MLQVIGLILVVYGCCALACKIVEAEGRTGVIVTAALGIGLLALLGMMVLFLPGVMPMGIGMR